MSTSNRAFITERTGEKVAVDPPEGGPVVMSGTDVKAPGTVAATTSGVGLGPLYMGVPESAVVSIDELTYLPGQSDGGLPLIGLGIAAAPAPDEDSHQPSFRRRTFLLLAAAIFSTQAAEAQTDEETVALNIARTNVVQSDGPIQVRILDIVDEALPTTTEIMVDAQETRRGKIASPSEGVTLPTGTTGEIKVYLRDSEGLLGRLLAWARGVIGGDEEIEYARELPQPANEYAQDTFVRLSSHPALVEPVKASGAGATSLVIGNTQIPHSDDADNPAVGSYGVFDGSLIYEVGSSPPASAEWMLRTRLGALARLSQEVGL